MTVDGVWNGLRAVRAGLEQSLKWESLEIVIVDCKYPLSVSFQLRQDVLQ